MTAPSASANTYDAIVIGAGATGSVAVEKLVRSGLNVCLLDAGGAGRPAFRPLQMALQLAARTAAKVDWTANAPPTLVNAARRGLRGAGLLRQPQQRRFYAWELDPGFFVDERDYPYETTPGTDFVWVRAQGAGGRMAAPGHGLQFFRFNPSCFQRRAGDVVPVDAREMEHWYEEIEASLALSGTDATSPHVPALRLSHTRAPNAIEAIALTRLQTALPHVHATLGFTAAWTDRLASARASGRLTVCAGAVVDRIEIGEDGAVRAVHWKDAHQSAPHRAEAPLVFLCASALESTRILMLSASARHPRGLGGHSDALGAHLMDHVLVSASGHGPAMGNAKISPVQGHSIFAAGFEPQNQPGAPDYKAAEFGMQIYLTARFGGATNFYAVSFGNMQPRAENRVALHESRRDRHGQPVLTLTCQHSAADLALARRQAGALREAAEALGVSLHGLSDQPSSPGLSAHECGTARMGIDAQTSVLDASNQVWSVPGLYVTDASALPVMDIFNPTLTLMALTTRAVSHALGNAPVQRAASESVNALR